MRNMVLPAICERSRNGTRLQLNCVGVSPHGRPTLATDGAVGRLQRLPVRCLMTLFKPLEVEVPRVYRLYLLLSLCLVTSVESQFATQNVTFLSTTSIVEMGGGTLDSGSDIWGWTDSLTDKDYALFTHSSATAFVDVTDGANPIYLGRLPSHTNSSFWRDVKVYEDHAYIVSDDNGPHGLQVFDLTQLRGVTTPQVFSNTSHFDGFRSAHNIAINEQSGFAYVVGSDQAAGGLYIVDVRNPAAPSFAGQFSADGYTHDLQVVNYSGPDTNYSGSEIAFAANEDTLTIIDVTDKGTPIQLSRKTYQDARYAHQGWLSGDQKYFYMNDEIDEAGLSVNTRTHVWDVSDLTNPDYVGFHEHADGAVDHNLYVHDRFVFEANYRAGVRIFQQTDPAAAELTEVGFIDTFPENNSIDFGGAWSVYPFFDDGKFIVSDVNRGLFVAQFDLLAPGVADLNGDGVLGCADVNWLTAGVLANSLNPTFDLTGDGVANGADLDQWLLLAGAENHPEGIAFSTGDANLDGVVDEADFAIWNSNRFTSPLAWCSGDFNADGHVDVSDFNLWNTNRTSAHSALVPEPNAGSQWTWLALVVLGVKRVNSLRRRKCWRCLP